jgi:hypothetical protein
MTCRELASIVDYGSIITKMLKVLIFFCMYNMARLLFDLFSVFVYKTKFGPVIEFNRNPIVICLIGVIFVIDSADSVRMCVAKDELMLLMEHKGTIWSLLSLSNFLFFLSFFLSLSLSLTHTDSLLATLYAILSDMKRPVPLLFYANKKDLPRSRTPAEVSSRIIFLQEFF